METIKHAIRRDGIALARIPQNMAMEITRYGARDPVGMIKFRLTCFPDISSFKIIPVCVMYVVNQLEGRIRLAGEVSLVSEVAPGDKSLALSRFYATETNIFRDILLTLLRRFYVSWREINVLFAFLIYVRMRI
jgi:hypothetical protein